MQNNHVHGIDQAYNPGLINRLLYLLLSVSTQVSGTQVKQNKTRYCFVLEWDFLSYREILKREASKAGFKTPDISKHSDSINWVNLYKNKRGLTHNLKRQGQPGKLLELINQVTIDPEHDVFIVPVSILIGRSPDKDWGIFRLFLSESWSRRGFLGRLLSILVHGRDTQVKFGSCISVSDIISQCETTEIASRRIARLARKELRNIRSAAIGPDLSHRHTMIRALLNSEQVQEAINQHASKHKINQSESREKARKFALEIAADYNYTLVRIAHRLLTWFWNKVYDGIDLNHVESLNQANTGAEIIYVPCHRSHFDYLLFSYILYLKGLVPPHIAA
ncbi:MAG: 1-acyl-sn-glycerol-3-phosphate acyltransferase, partial [bacterium]